MRVHPDVVARSGGGSKQLLLGVVKGHSKSPLPVIHIRRGAKLRMVVIRGVSGSLNSQGSRVFNGISFDHD